MFLTLATLDMFVVIYCMFLTLAALDMFVGMFMFEDQLRAL